MARTTARRPRPHAVHRGAVPGPPARARGARRPRSTIAAMAATTIAGFHAEHYRPDATWSWPRPATSTTTTSSPGVERRSAARRRRPARAPGAGRRRPRRRRVVCRPADRAGPPRRRLAGARPRRPRPVRAGRRSTRCSAAACRAGCSRRSARSGAWRTPCTRTAPPTRDTGALVVYAGTAPRTGRTRCSTLVDGEIDRLVADGITDDELDVAKGYLEGSMLLGLEDAAAAWRRIGRGMIAAGRGARRSTSTSRASEAVDARRRRTG